MLLKRTAYALSAVTSAAALTLCVSGTADAAANFTHAWNDSPSVNQFWGGSLSDLG